MDPNIFIKKRNFEALAGDVNTRSTVNFIVTFYSVMGLSCVKVIQKSISFFTSQIKVYFGRGGPIIKN